MTKFVAGSLKKNIDEWIKIGANSDVIQWIKNGVSLPFSSAPIGYECKNHALNVEQAVFIDREVSNLLKSKVISRVDYKPFCVNAIGCVPKKNKKLRLIVDLRPLNEHITVPNFKNEGIDVVCDQLQYGDQFISVDLKHGYYHIPVNPEYRSYLGFSWKKQYYVFNCLPFGLNISPFYFNKTIRAVVQYLRVQKLRYSSFVDDGLLASQPDCMSAQKELLLSTYSRLGFFINFEKSELSPKTSITFIGYVLNSVGEDNNPWISIPKARIYKLKRDIKRVLVKGSASSRFIARICGQCISFTKAIVPTKLLLRNLYRLLGSRQSWSDILLLDNASINDLKWWLAALDNWNGKPIIKKSIDLQIVTDASDSGWGGVCNGKEAAGPWTKPIRFKSINYRELLAVFLTIKTFIRELANKCIQILSDNITTVAHLNHLGGNIKDLSDLTKAIFNLAYIHNIDIQAKHLAGKQNIHADRLSRISENSTFQWKLNPRIFKLANRLYGNHTIDRFADLTNFQCKTYNSLHWDPYTSGIDALAQTNWNSHNNFVNPPIQLIPEVLKVITRQKANATIVAPFWPAQTWAHTLLTLSTAPPFELPNLNKVDWCIGKNPEPKKNIKWKYFLWRVSGRTH